MSAFGDIICALPVLRSLRASFPNARIGWVVDNRYEELIAQEPELDEVLVAPLGRWRKMARSPASWPRLFAERRRLTRELRHAGYDVSLDLQGIMKSGFIARAASCPRNLQMAGDHLGNKQWFFPGERVPENGPHAVDRMLPLAAALGADISRPRFDLHVPEDARDYARQMLESHGFDTNGPIVALNPGAFAPHRIWPADNFVAAAQCLREQINARIVILGGPDEVDLGERIAREADVNALCTAGKTSLLQLAAVLQCCHVAVSGDTGPMHLAVGVGKPVVALFGPANPARTGPYGEGHIVIQKPFPCQPCYAHPTCRDYACMKAIEVEDVCQAVRKLAQPP